jgi:hypothetical protein
MAMSAADITSRLLDHFGLSRARVMDHSNRSAEEMDARAAIAYTLHTRLGYTGRRAAQALGYKKSTLTHAWDRLRLRMYASRRLRDAVDQLFPENARAA